MPLHLSMLTYVPLCVQFFNTQRTIKNDILQSVSVTVSVTLPELQIVGTPAPVTHNFSKWRIAVKVYAPDWRVIKIKKLTDEL